MKKFISIKCSVPTNKKRLSTSDPNLAGKKFWSDDEWENVEEKSDDIQDPRIGEWKIQKRNGFMKDREDKEKSKILN